MDRRLLMQALADYRNPTQLRELGCTCEFGCSKCGMDGSQMGNCPGWYPCPVGRAPHADCPIKQPDHSQGAS